MQSHIVCPSDCRLVRFLLWAPRFITQGLVIEACRVEQDTTSWVRISWGYPDA